MCLSDIARTARRGVHSSGARRRSRTTETAPTGRRSHGSRRLPARAAGSAACSSTARPEVDVEGGGIVHDDIRRPGSRPAAASVGAHIDRDPSLGAFGLDPETLGQAVRIQLDAVFDPPRHGIARDDDEPAQPLRCRPIVELAPFMTDVDRGFPEDAMSGHGDSVHRGLPLCIAAGSPYGWRMMRSAIDRRRCPTGRTWLVTSGDGSGSIV
jgi:hypothetical protein